MKKFLVILSGLLSLINVSGQNMHSIADSNNMFAFSLYHKLENDNNLFYSPFSISSALAMTYAGARNETEKQMSSTLFFSLNQDQFHKGFKQLSDSLKKDNVPGIQVDIANALWLERKYPFLDSYLNLVKANYESELKEADFENEAERKKAVEQINQWVEQKTANKIRNIVSDENVNEYTRLILVNAIYFKGKWKDMFVKEYTREDSFYLDKSNFIKAKFMNTNREYNYYDDKLLQAIEIPYKDDKMSMIVFLPKKSDGIGDVEKEFTYKYYSGIIGSFTNGKVVLSLPRFKTSTSFQLKDALSDLGMPLAFTDAADFSGITDNKDLHITNVIHKAYIDVSEEGTEAAGSTVITMETTSYHPPYFFKATHPFIFVIKDNTTGAILFMGKVMNPTESAE